MVVIDETSTAAEVATPRSIGRIPGFNRDSMLHFSPTPASATMIKNLDRSLNSMTIAGVCSLAL